MSYRVIVEKKIIKFLNRIPLRDSKRIEEAINEMSDNPFSGDVIKLQGSDDEYRRRVGKYRIIFTVDHGELTVCVVDAGDRKNIYD